MLNSVKVGNGSSIQANLGQFLQLGAVGAYATAAKNGTSAGETGGFDLDDFRAALELSLLSQVNLVKAALPQLKKAGWGRILLLATNTGPVIEPSVRLPAVHKPGLDFQMLGGEDLNSYTVEKPGRVR